MEERLFGYLNQVTEHHNYLLRDKRDDKRVGFYRNPFLMTKVNDWHREILMI